MNEEKRAVVAIERAELVELYQLLLAQGSPMSRRIIGLMDRIEKTLYRHLSIEEIEGIAALDPDSVEELAKKL